MKTKLTMLTVLLAFGGLFASPLAAAPGKMHQVDRVVVPTRSEDITVGASLNFVRQTIGSADEQLTPNLWQYHNFKGASDDCRELVLYFENDEVAGIFLANRKACAVMTGRINKGQPELIAMATTREYPAGTEIASVK